MHIICVGRSAYDSHDQGTTDGQQRMNAGAGAGLVGQFKFECAIILLLVNIILGFVLMSNIEFIRSHGSFSRTASAHPIVSPVAKPGVQPASAAPAAQPAAIQPAAATISAGGAVWPLRGRVTTEFGVPEPPYQPHHTGIDISSAQPAGRAAITPFRAGTVIKTISSNSGLGNHVIVDHGGGLTSYYCHMNSIAVHEGQQVKPGDTIGFEGRTGTATGPHLHLEIRENNTPVNPRSYISGNPI